MYRLLTAALLLTLTLGAPRAAEIALFNDANRVSDASFSSLEALLAGLGHQTSTFTGRSGAEFSAGLNGADLVVFPELLNYAQLVAELESGALFALNDFVSAGGGLIAVGDYGFRLLNAVFYPVCGPNACFASSGTGGASELQTGVAAGTAYAAAPASLSVPPTPPGAVNPFNFFPADGLDLYHDGFGSSTVFTAPIGAGQYGFLAWGYAGSVPSGTLDGGWVDLLGIMVDEVAAPEPAAALLLGGWLPLLALRRAPVRAKLRARVCTGRAQPPGIGSERKNSR